IAAFAVILTKCHAMLEIDRPVMATGQRLEEQLSREAAMAQVLPPRGPNRFKERELARVLRAAQRIGGVDRVEIAGNGAINLVLTKQGDKAGPQAVPVAEWDEATA